MPPVKLVFLGTDFVGRKEERKTKECNGKRLL
jgi:hypothetical protein